MSDAPISAGSVETPADVGITPSGVCKRWALEIALAEKQRKDWKKDVEEALEIYQAKKRKANSFNILWANTETLRPAIYNSLPRPDVRKRFDDPDKAGAAAAEMLERALTYSLDVYGADGVFRMSALDAVLAGRAVARVRYVPAFSGSEESPGAEIVEGTQHEEIESEQCVPEHVQWDDFLHGPGKTWAEVTWVAFRHRMTRTQLKERFPEVGALVEMDAAEDEEIKKADEIVANTFKTAEVWEIWDKDSRQAIFIATGHKEQPLAELDDPLGLIGFFPVPEPVFAIEKTDTLVPSTPYSMYREQANELSLISGRIAKITAALKLRGIYDSTIGEMKKLMDAGDNVLIPAENLTVLLEKGSIEKAIWMMPIGDAASVLTVLEGQRAACKQVIYEITGISDIVRGASNANETATAQQIKAQFGTIRLQRLQREFQRYVRDITRMMAEVIGEKFQPEGLMAMTSMQMPTEQQVQRQVMQVQQQYAMAAQQAKATGQQAPQPPQLPPPPVTIDAVMQVLRSDLQRQYRVDIETDSTIQAMEGADQAAISALLTGIGGFVQSVAPAVQGGIIPAEAAKALLSSIVRKFKLGSEVDDAFSEEAQEQGMPPQVQQAMQQVQEAQQQVQEQAQQVQQGMAEVDQGKKDLEHQKALNDMRNENDRLKIEHATQIHQMAMEKQNDATVHAVRSMLDDHMATVQQHIASVTNAPL